MTVFKGKKFRKTKAGFTLLEIILSLLLVGVMAAVGGMAIVKAVQGYTATKENTTTTLKAQTAIARITREIIEMVGITADAGSSLLPVRNVARNVTIGFHEGTIKIAPEGVALAAGDILLDNVHSLTFTYYSGETIISPPTTAYDIRNLTAIDVLFRVARADGVTLTFTNRVSPRNNKNQGGAVPTSPPPTAPQYGACFVATVAFGDPEHPAVQLLREFREHFLLTWAGGQVIAAEYQKQGPKLARLVEGRAAALSIIRGILYLVATLTFFLIYEPWVLLLFVVTSSLLAAKVLKTRGRRLTTGHRFFPERGSALIGLIITMVIMSTLGAAMLTLFSTSQFSQVYADQSRKAYFLAESGFRYAASEFLNAGTEAAKQTVLTNLNNKTCNLLNNRGSFTTIVYPYWTRSQTFSGTTLTTQQNGTIPPEFNTGTGGFLQIGAGNFYSYSSRTGAGTTVTFSGLSPTTPAPAANQDVLPVALPASSVTVSNGGNLTLSATGADAFPPLNGNFTLSPTPTGLSGGLVFNYEKRVGNILYNITLADATKTWTNFSVTSGSITTPATTKIVLDKFLRLSSRGNYSGTIREVVYNVPVGWMAGAGEFAKQQDHDPGMTGWSAPAGGGGGAHSVQTIDGGAALKVDSTVTLPGGGSWAMRFFTGHSNTNLAKAWFDAQGFLSYDLQVKVYNTLPHFFAGVNFRTRNNSDLTDLYYYGVSLVKPRQTRGCILVCGTWGSPSDQVTALIPGYASDAAAGPLFSNPGLFQNLEQTPQPLIGTQERYGLPAIVLWERTAAGFQWLAYRTLTTADGIVFAPASPANALRLTNWTTLMVRVAEGFSLTFNNGGGTSGTGVPIKEGDVIETLDKTSSARVVMTPILTSGSWSSRNAAGTLVLANIKTGATAIAAGVPLFVNGVQRANATAAIAATKRNYLRVYYTRPTAQGTANAIQTDNNRLANPRNSVNWPPDDLTELTAANDFVTLVQWTGFNTGVFALTSSSEPNAIIVDGDLTTPTWTATSTTADFNFVAPSPFRGSGDSIALITSGGAAASTYYDDFAIQLDQKAGTGFLPPIQQ